MANRRLNAVITIGGAVSGAFRSAIGQTRNGLSSIGRSISELQNRQRELNRTIAEQERLGATGSALRHQYAQQELNDVNRQLEALRRRRDLINQTNNAISAGRAQMASAAAAIGATAAAAAVGFVPVVQAAAFEKAMLGVAKQVDGARDSAGQLTQVYYDMAKQVQMLGREMPMATNEIADMVAAGARMGVAKDELIGFTRTAGMMAAAFELPAGELADQMGKIANLFSIPIPEIGKLGDVINYLDDNALSKGGDIIDVMQRIGGVAAFVKMPAKEAAALGSTFLTLGSRADVAATAANAAMRELSIAAMQPKRFQQGLQAIGLDAKKVQSDMSKDATGTILKVLDSLNQLPDEKRLTVATQLFGKEYGDDIAKLSSGVDEYRRQLTLATGNTAFAGQIKDAEKMKDALDKASGAADSMKREFDATMRTTSAQWEVAKNTVTELSVNIGSVLLPSVNQFLGVFGRATVGLADFAQEHPVLIGNIATLAGTLGGLFIAVKSVSFGVGAATVAFNSLKLAIATNPIGLALVALTTAAVLIYQNWEPIKGFFSGLWDSIVAGAKASFEWVMAKLAVVGEYWGKAKAALGFGGGAAIESGAASMASVPPPVPSMATARGGSVSNTQNNTINISQQPGQDSKALAEEVARRIAEKQAVTQRGRMYDMALGY